MPRANRYFIPGRVYHLTHRCHNRGFLLRFVKDLESYQKTLRLTLAEHEVSLLDFCLTRNHVHLLAYAEESDQISQLMQQVQGQFAQIYNRRKKRTGAFWEDRFHSTMIEPGGHLEHCMVYIALNMVRCGVVNHPNKWPWSGYHELKGNRKRFQLLDKKRLLELLGGRKEEEFQKHYDALITDAINKGDFRRQSKWTESIAVGRESFVRETESMLKGRQSWKTTGAGEEWCLKEAGNIFPFGMSDDVENGGR